MTDRTTEAVKRVELIRFESRDGKLWETQAIAEQRNALLDDCDRATAILGPRPEWGAFGLDRSGCVAHGEAVGLAYHRQCVALARKYMPGQGWWAKWDAEGVKPEDVHPSSIVARVLDDSANLEPLRRLWWRLECIDTKGSEFEQPYWRNQRGAK